MAARAPAAVSGEQDGGAKRDHVSVNAGGVRKLHRLRRRGERQRGNGRRRWAPARAVRSTPACGPARARAVDFLLSASTFAPDLRAGAGPRRALSTFCCMRTETRHASREPARAGPPPRRRRSRAHGERQPRGNGRRRWAPARAVRSAPACGPRDEGCRLSALCEHVRARPARRGGPAPSPVDFPLHANRNSTRLAGARARRPTPSSPPFTSARRTAATWERALALGASACRSVSAGAARAARAVDFLLYANTFAPGLRDGAGPRRALSTFCCMRTETRHASREPAPAGPPRRRRRSRAHGERHRPRAYNRARWPPTAPARGS